MPKSKKQKVTFSFTGPEAETVQVAGDFTGWQQAPISLKKDKTGVTNIGSWSMDIGAMIHNVQTASRISSAARIAFA